MTSFRQITSTLRRDRKGREIDSLGLRSGSDDGTVILRDSKDFTLGIFGSVEAAESAVWYAETNGVEAWDGVKRPHIRGWTDY
jgi:hypothetical protein|tara:strand:+ start:1434 stop:1682 length:249 start_codon:yes stop_codon:yes gene_type:complete